jgi:hypothetical protein
LAETKKKPDDLKLSGGKGADWWVAEVSKSRQGWRDYRAKGNKVIARYRNKREQPENNRKRFNILYSNTETLGPAIYGQVPVPDIRRRWADKDPVGRLSAQILQRATQFCMDAYDFDSVLKASRQDYLLPGFAVARVKYKPYIKQTPKKGEDGAEMKGKDGKPVFDEELIYQEAQTEYVPWDRFIMSRSRQYSRVWYVGFADDLTKDEVEAQFGAEVAGSITYNRREEGTSGDGEKHESTARIWEIWCKRGRGRFMVAEGWNGWVLKPEPDPLRLEQFFPNAKPIWSISTNDTLEPVPEFLEYEDQALELDDLTERIDVLTSALRRRGVYDAEFSTLRSMLANQDDNNFVPIDNWAAFASKGGLEKLALELPITGVVEAIGALEDRRERVKQVIYEVTGIADIVRGSSNPNETKGAQEIKNRWAGLRISTRQGDFAKFARDLVRLKAEVIAERFDPETLSLMSGIKLPMQAQKVQYQQEQAAQQQRAQMAAQQAQAAGQQPPPPPQPNPEEAKFYAQPSWEEILAVLRSDKLRGFKIDIETDSTVQPDADAEKQSRTELITSLGAFSRETGVPIPPQLASQMIQFAMRAYKVGSQMEQELEALEQNPGPTPQQQQKEQELQQREQQVQEAEAKAKDEQHRTELAQKDAENQANKLKADQALFDLEKRYEQQIKAITEDFANQVRELTVQSEEAVRGTIQELNTGAVQ